MPSLLEAQFRHAKHYLATLVRADALYQRGQGAIQLGISLFDSEWANIQTGRAWAGSHAGEDMSAASMSTDYSTAGVRLLHLRRHPNESIGWLEEGLAAVRVLGDRRAEVRHLTGLGQSYRQLGDARAAVGLYDRALELARKAGDPAGEEAVLGNIGNSYFFLGDSRRAIEFHEQNLRLAREIGNQRNEGAALNNLAASYSALGRFRDAVKFYEDALSTGQKSFFDTA